MSDGYAGDLNLEETWKLLNDNPATVLIDVRTEMEWDTVGIPDTSELKNPAHFIEWNHAGGVHNERFVAEVEAAVQDKEAPIVLLCRSGARSASGAAALTRAGYSLAYNISGGFEGPGAAGNGWQDNLPSTTR